MVFQQGALFEWLTVAENVDFGLRMKKEDPIKTAKKVDEWLEYSWSYKALEIHQLINYLVVCSKELLLHDV